MVHRTSDEASSVLLTADLVIADASLSYCEQTLVDRDEIRGVALFDCFPESGDARTASAPTVRSVLNDVARTGRSNRMPLIRYDILDPESGSSALVERYWVTNNHPVYVAGSDEVSHIALEVRDVTSLVFLERQLEQRAQALVEQQALLHLMQSDFERAGRDLAIAKRHVAAHLAGDETIGDDASMKAVEDAGVLGPSTHAPRAGIYRALHAAKCQSGALRVFARKGQPLPRCADCGDRVRYRWKA